MRQVYRIQEELFFEGIGIFSGERTRIRIRPIDEKEIISLRKSIGISSAQNARNIFFSVSFLGQSELLCADLSFVLDTSKRTTVLGGKKLRVSTVEHLMSALSQHSIEDILIELEGCEIPILDGSSRAFSQEFQRTKKECFKDSLEVLSFTQNFQWQEKESLYAYFPYEGCRFSVVIDYPHEELIGTQSISYEAATGNYQLEIAPARTFCTKKELDWMLQSSLIKGGSLDNGVVLDGADVLSTEGLRFNDEMARHKMLDLLGDFALSNYDLHGHIVAFKPSHYGNITFTQILVRKFEELQQQGGIC